MNEQQQSLDTLRDIRNMMERSSRFISLSGWSGVAAGICALVGAFAARMHLNSYEAVSDRSVVIARSNDVYTHEEGSVVAWLMNDKLFQIAVLTFIFACISAFVFTYFKSQKQGLKLWDKSSERLMINMLLPLATGGIFIYRLITLGYYGMIAPACLVFYGLALLNASKYTFNEIRWLGITEIILGLVCFWNTGNGLYYWAAGFGVLHIIYGVVMWWKYERNPNEL